MRIIFLPILSLALTMPSAAQMYGSDYKKCSEQSTLDIVNCVNASTRVWNRRLNTAYQALLGRSEPVQRDALKAAQRLWIQYRDSNCHFYASGEGSIRQIEGAECVRSMTQHRACELEAAKRDEDGVGAECE